MKVCMLAVALTCLSPILSMLDWYFGNILANAIGNVIKWETFLSDLVTSLLQRQKQFLAIAATVVMSFMGEHLGTSLDMIT